MKALLFALAMALSATVAAQPYPSKVVKMVVPYAAGGATDVVTRAVAQRLSPMWGRPVVIENKPGANTNIAAAEVAKAPADGYTLLATAEATFAVNPYVYATLPYDVKDYVPVSGLGIINQVLAVHPSLPYRSVAEVIAAAKAQPGKLNYAAFGPGSSPHLNMEMFLSMAGVQMTAVHYKGGAPALTDVIGGHVSMIILSTTLTAKPYKAGQLRILGVGTRERLAAFPEIPTIAESGLPGYEAVSWFGLFAPAGTPREVVSKVNADVQRVLADPDFREKFLAPNYFEPVTGSPEQFADYVKREADKWSKLILASKITIE
ncbi:MAG TPA: tripartite tricarboxylate transporter substrate binding protein [Burkholderiales bacterium]